MDNWTKQRENVEEVRVSEIDKKVGAKIEKIIKERGLKQNVLAKKIGISPSYFNAIVKQKARISLELLEKIAKVLDIPLSYLLEENAREQSLEKYLEDPDFIIHFSAYKDFKSLPENEQKEALRKVLESYKKAVEAAKKMEEGK